MGKQIKVIEDKKKIELFPFSKINYLKVRWEDENLTIKGIREYNDWSSKQRYKIIMFELMLEHYLTKNIIYDLKGNDDLFSDINYERYFTKLSRSDKIFKSVIKNIKNTHKGSSVSVEFMKELTFGKKMIIWKALKKNVFKNKFMGVRQENQKQLIAALDNMRNVRNGIAHMNSKNQTLNKMKYITKKDVARTKTQLYNDSMKLCHKMKVVLEGDKNE